MKMVVHHETPVQEKDYEGLADILRHEAMDKASVTQILHDDPKFAAWFKAQKK